MKNRCSLAAAVTVFLFGCSDADPVGLTPTDEALAFSGGETQMRQVTEFTMFLQQETILNPGACIRVDGDGTLHFRGCETVADVTGDFVGVEFATIHLVVDVNGNGQAGGSATFNLTHDDFGSGTFEGQFEGPIVAGEFRGHAQARGPAGDFVGLKMDAISTNTQAAPRPFVVTGTIR